MEEIRLYTKDEVCQIVWMALSLFENSIRPDAESKEGDSDMAKRLKQFVTVQGRGHWITGNDTQGLLDSYARLLTKEGALVPPIANQNGGRKTILFGEYLTQYVNAFKSKQGTTTMVNRDRIIRNHILPQLGSIPIDQITTSDIQRWFDEMADKGYSKETILKIKSIINPAFDGAVEDGYIKRNPLHSNRIHIGGKETVHHKAIPNEKMKVLRDGLNFLDIREQRMALLLSTTGMRFEEVLGLRWEDIDFYGGWIDIRRAVVHPRRNSPEVKIPKTNGSVRRIPVPREILRGLGASSQHGFLLYSYSDMSMETPLSYSEARRSFEKIRTRFNLQGYTAHDFRDTCATEWREAGVPTDMIARMLGHTNSEITERRYVKYRDELFDGIRSAMGDIGIKMEQKEKDAL